MKLYKELASWWPLFSPPDQYVEEAQFFRDAIFDNCNTVSTAVLELGSGGGNNASHLKSSFHLTLVDSSQQMLEISRKLNPECEHIVGDMRTVRLGKVFGAVFIHDAIMYMVSERDLQKAIKTAFLHCGDGGAAVFVPDFTRETFAPFTSHGGRDDNTRGIRYLIWGFDLDPSDSVYSEYFSILLRDRNGSVTFEHEEHIFGLFARETWKRLMLAAGFEPKIITDSYGRDVFVGKKLSSSLR